MIKVTWKGLELELTCTRYQNGPRTDLCEVSGAREPRDIDKPQEVRTDDEKGERPTNTWRSLREAVHHEVASSRMTASPFVDSFVDCTPRCLL